MKNIHALAFAGLLCFGLANAAAPPNMEAVNTVLPEEGAPKAERGTYATVAEIAFGTTALKVVRPEDLERFPKRDKLPVVIWANGGCAMETPRAAGFFETIASHGFLVVTTASERLAPGATPPPAGARRSATKEDLLAAITWAEKENGRDGSHLQGKIQTGKVAVMGQSCGGRLAIEAGNDARVDTIGVFNSGIEPEQYPALAQLRGPVLFINGGERDFMMGASKANFDAVEKLPTFYGSRHGAGHTATMYHPGGGEWANVAWSWAAWQLKGDSKAAKMFVGEKCGLCTNENWDVAAKRLK
jgi:dienelactone hydrolase